jgi:hypothetical protein
MEQGEPAALYPSEKRMNKAKFSLGIMRIRKNSPMVHWRRGCNRIIKIKFE